MPMLAEDADASYGILVLTDPFEGTGSEATLDAPYDLQLEYLRPKKCEMWGSGDPKTGVIHNMLWIHQGKRWISGTGVTNT